MTRDPIRVAGCQMPSFRSMADAEARERTDLEIRNDRFVEALWRCIRNGGAG